MRAIVLVALLCCTGCFLGQGGSIGGEDHHKIAKDSLVSLEVVLRNADSMDSSKNQAVLTLTNVSHHTILAEIPNVFGAIVYPLMTDEEGNRLQVLFRVRVNVDLIKTVELHSGQSVESSFMHHIDECFDYSSKGTYSLWFEYYGRVADSAGTEISDDTSIKSNIIEIITE